MIESFPSLKRSSASCPASVRTRKCEEQSPDGSRRTAMVSDIGGSLRWPPLVNMPPDKRSSSGTTDHECVEASDAHESAS